MPQSGPAGTREPGGRRRRPRPTIRLRLTVLYAGLFLITGAALLGLSYVLVDESLTRKPAELEDIALDQRGAPSQTSPTATEQAEERLKTAVREQLADDTLDRLALQYGLALIGLTALSVALGWIVAGRVLRPIQDITRTARRVSQDNLGERIDPSGPEDELRDLAVTFDSMLDRLEAAFASQRRFVANASHELRTPLTIMRTEIDVALADENAGAEELRAMAEAVRGALARSERLIEGLLTLARSDAALPRTDVVDLADAVRLGLHGLREEIDERRLDVRTALATARVQGDRPLLERLVANLLENAVRHNVDGGWVEVRVASERPVVRLTVSNGGEVIDATAADELLQPFQRRRRRPADTGSVSGQQGLPARPPAGAGLGLSIVQAVTRAHGGKVTLTPRAGGGLDVEVELPSDAAANVRLDRLAAPGAVPVSDESLLNGDVAGGVEHRR
jgi:signal transduction histidine kinase